MSSVGKDVEYLALHTLLVGVKTAATTWKATWQKDLELDNATSAFTPAQAPTSTCLPTNPQENVHNSTIHNNLKWKQPKCPSTAECINKFWHSHRIKSMNKNKLLHFTHIMDESHKQR